MEKISTGTIRVAGSFGFAQDRLFDCASCDKTARGSAQDDSFVMDQYPLTFCASILPSVRGVFSS
jgi:hypothetical protein